MSQVQLIARVISAGIAMALAGIAWSPAELVQLVRAAGNNAPIVHLLIGVLAVLSAVCLIRGYQSQSRAHLRHQQSIDGERINFTKAISHMPHGLVMFDRGGRIVLCNRRYIELYNLSPEIVIPGLSIRQLLHHRKKTGSFTGDVDAYWADMAASLANGKKHSFIATTPDGRVVRIVNEPLEDGGWVATHEDITERQLLLEAQFESEKLVSEQKRQLDVALNNMTHGICMFDSAGHIVLFNRRYSEMMGQSAEFLQGLSLLELFKHRKMSGAFRGEPEEFFASIMTSVAEGKTTVREMIREDAIALRVVDQPLEGGGWVATYEDVTEQRRTQRERDQNRAFLDLIIDNVPSAIFVKSAAARKYVLVNRAAEQFWGVKRQDMIGKTARDVFSEVEARKIQVREDHLLQSGKPIFDEREVFSPSNGTRTVFSRRMTVRDQADAAQYVLAVVDDVTERKLAEAKITELAHFDPLTKLPNRTLFRKQLEKELPFVRAEAPLALLYIDLDQFKHVNDTLGHPAGDELLKAVAERLQNCLRESDLIARLGGDEFAIVRTKLESPEEAGQFAQTLREAVTATSYDLDGHQAITDLSIGIALSPVDGTEIDELVKHADLALYAAKTEGRASCRYFAPEMHERMKQRRALEIDLRSAIANEEFELYYQPIVAIQEEAITSFEALLRWHHPHRGILLPLEFIPAAEETGLIDTIGEWVLRRACVEAKKWPSHINVAVNVSAVQFRKVSLALTIARILAETELWPSRLELEITESVLLQNSSATLTTLHQIRTLGVRISMDDFGTGYSSLSSLRSFPFDRIKIDRSFIADISNADSSMAVVQAILTLASSLKMKTTAEGVETPVQRKLLQATTCDEMQGYLFSPPRPAKEIAPLISACISRPTEAA